MVIWISLLYEYWAVLMTFDPCVCSPSVISWIWFLWRRAWSNWTPSACSATKKPLTPKDSELNKRWGQQYLRLDKHTLCHILILSSDVKPPVSCVRFPQVEVIGGTDKYHAVCRACYGGLMACKENHDPQREKTPPHVMSGKPLAQSAPRKLFASLHLWAGLLPHRFNSLERI